MNQTAEKIFLEIKESLVMAMAALRINKLRSVLTLLGIAVGVFSIIAVMTAMGVLVNSIESGMSQLGANTFQVQKNPVFGSDDPAERAKLRNRKNITYEQALQVREKTTLASAVGLESWQFGKVISSMAGIRTNPSVSVGGENVEGFATNNWTIGDGRMFSQDELGAGRKVAVLGEGVQRKLFPRGNPVGEHIRVSGVEYQVIGLVESKGEMLGGNNDNFVIVPITTYFNQFGHERSINIMVQAASREVVDDAIEQVRGILRTARNVPPGEPDDFDIFSNDSVLAEFDRITKYIKLGIMFISAIALIAAGVGIMNIMLVSVTERTREIGIRKAVGARKNNILAQFIMEAIVLSELGGLIGITLGVIGGNLAAIPLEVPPVIPWDWAAIGVIICSVVGIVFGVYPAWKAANLDPIESLRYE
jgi:putative ABC transport system permease protein